MNGCANSRQADVWINDEIKTAYQNLFQLGVAHSIGIYDKNEQLVGGLYGVEFGGFFAGESMFHKARDASKVALYWLTEKLKSAPGERLLDVQWLTPHLASLGAIEIARSEYLKLLQKSINEKSAFKN
jgi:leucyl/phenylalanyl-tRNA--protein transferase